MHYRDDSGRNDIAAAKVARDRRNLYFYVRAVAPLTPKTHLAWMVLLLDTDQNAAADWRGYDYRVAAGRLERWGDGWKPVKTIKIRIAGAAMQLTVPRPAVRYRNGFDFKWTDHDDGTFLKGDAAPLRRFRHRYEGR